MRLSYTVTVNLQCAETVDSGNLLINNWLNKTFVSRGFPC